MASDIATPLHVHQLQFLGVNVTLPSGCSASVTPFDEEEIVAGDFVKVELDRELFKMMHEAVGLWNDDMLAVRRLHIKLRMKTKSRLRTTCIQS